MPHSNKTHKAASRARKFTTIEASPEAAPAVAPRLVLAVVRRVGRVLLHRVVCVGLGRHAPRRRHELLLRRHHGGLLARSARPQAHLQVRGQGELRVMAQVREVPMHR